MKIFLCFFYMSVFTNYYLFLPSIYYSHHLSIIFITYLLFYHIGLYVKKGIIKEYKTDFGVVPNLVKLFQHLYGTLSVRKTFFKIFHSKIFYSFMKLLFLFRLIWLFMIKLFHNSSWFLPLIVFLHIFDNFFKRKFQPNSNFTRFSLENINIKFVFFCHHACFLIFNSKSPYLLWFTEVFSDLILISSQIFSHSIFLNLFLASLS